MGKLLTDVGRTLVPPSGAQFVLHADLSASLGLALLLLVVTSVTTRRLSSADAAWARPGT